MSLNPSDKKKKRLFTFPCRPDLLFTVSCLSCCTSPVYNHTSPTACGVKMTEAVSERGEAHTALSCSFWKQVVCVFGRSSSRVTSCFLLAARFLAAAWAHLHLRPTPVAARSRSLWSSVTRGFTAALTSSSLI